MAARKNTSERLERALARYDLETLPDETKQMLEETMNRSDFDPDKLAKAIEREEKNHETEERCPWYIALSRFVALILFVGGMFGFFCATLQLAVVLFDKISGANLSEWIISIQNSHRVAFYGASAVCFVVFFFWFVARLGKTMVGEE